MNLRKDHYRISPILEKIAEKKRVGERRVVVAPVCLCLCLICLRLRTFLCRQKPPDGVSVEQ